MVPEPGRKTEQEMQEDPKEVVNEDVVKEMGASDSVAEPTETDEPKTLAEISKAIREA